MSVDLLKDELMKPADNSTDLAKADAEAVFDCFAHGTPLDPEIAKRVRERGQSIREQVFQQHGLLDVAVPAIRELRGELPNS